MQSRLSRNHISRFGLTVAPAALLLAVGFAAAPAQAQISGFGSGFTLNGQLEGYNNGATTITPASNIPTISGGGTTLQITDTAQNTVYPDSNGVEQPIGGEQTSAFYGTQQDITNFVATFDYQENTIGQGNAFGPADGFTFAIQNDPRGVNALGESAQDLGYGTGGVVSAISPSAAVEFNLFGIGNRNMGTGFFTDGNTGAGGGYNTPGTVNLDSTDPFAITLSYFGASDALTETITDLNDPTATYSTIYTGVDLASIVGSNDAYIGFTGGTGGGVSNQYISNFSFISGTATAPTPEVGTSASFGLLLVAGLGAAALGRKRRVGSQA